MPDFGERCSHVMARHGKLECAHSPLLQAISRKHEAAIHAIGNRCVVAG